jgi:hypothetical protein
MSVIKKTLFDEKLEKINVLINDTDTNSKYFKITELNDTFTGGKNAFLIQGSEYLVSDTVIKIQIKDASGNTIYYEPGEGMVSSSVNGESFVSEYYEGTSKVVSVYIYPNKTVDANGNPLDGTAFGPATITILGELKEYESNGLILPVPDNWKDTYNVKWTRTVNVNPSLPNVTKIRFYKRPTATIKELLQPLYSIDSGTGLKVDSGISQSFAQINLSNLETFAGDVKRVKVYRTSQGDISDYDLIQDVLLESKELLTTFGLSGSVIGETGIFTSETLKNYWNTGSLLAELTSSRVESGLKLSGSGIFTYTQSLDINSANTYELNLDAFYSSSTNSNLGIYLNQITTSMQNGVPTPLIISSSIGTLYGTNPTKNLSDTVIPFSLTRNYPSASLYFSQSRGEWHLGNISLKLSQDTAFSPDSVSFITTMPTILGNDVFNFKFEFYDLNNNYVPVFVTQSATFVGAPIDTGALVSASLSQSLDALFKVSSSISGTMTVYSSSASGSITTVSGSVFSLSGSVSSSLTSLSSSFSQSNATILSSSLSKVQQLADGQYSGSFIGSDVIYSPTIGGQQGYISSFFKVGTAPSIYLDARQIPRKIFIGGAIPSGQTEYSGAYNNANTPVYLDSAGQFSLGNKLSYNTLGNLEVNGTINITGGNAATDANAQLYASRAVSSGSVSANAAQTAAELFAASAAGRAVTSGSNSATAAQSAAITQAKSDASASINLLANGNWTAGNTFISSRSISSPVLAGNAGYISEILKVGQNGITLNGGNSKIYVGTGTYNSENTPFYFASGSTDVFSLGNKLKFDGNNLTITGTINASSFNGGTITIGSKFSVDNLGNISATDASLTGTVNANTGRFGSGANFWSIGASTVENSVTTNGRLVLNAARPAMEIYDGSNDLRVDISAASSFSSVVPLTITTSGDVTGQTSLATGNKGYGGSGASFYDSTQYFHNQSVTFSGATAVGKVATIKIPLIGNPGGQSVGGENIIGNVIGITFGVRITKGDGSVVATITGTRTASTGTVGAATLATYAGTTLTTGLTLENTTYTVTPFISNLNMQAYSSAPGFVDSLAATVYTPDFNGAITVSVPVGKTEIVAGGIQIIRDSDNYVKIDRAAGSGAILAVTGEGTFTGDVTANTTSDIRLKENIVKIPNAIDKVLKISGNTFKWKEGFENVHSKKGMDVGIIAQEIENVIPNVVVTRKNGYKGVQYEKLVALLIEAIKELKTEIDELKNK